MKASVIVPLYNKAPYIKRTLDSIAAQTFADFEILVVDDGSTDGGADVVASHSDRRVRLIRQANAGPGAARNRGMDEAAGQYLTFLDADDEWLPTFLETCIGLLEQHGPEVASVTSSYIIDPMGRSMEPLWRQRGLRDGVCRLHAALSPQLVVHLLAYLLPCSTVARAERLRRWGGFCSRGKCLYGEDSYLWLKFLLNETVAVHLEDLVRYHTEASALTRQTAGPRPIEAILLYPEDVYAACPEALQGLLEKVLAVRALKTACMLGYWGRWREGRELLREFCPWSAWRLPRFGMAQVCATPLGAAAGVLWRSLQGAR